MKRAYIELPEGQMHYRHAGAGPALIMLHMSGSSSDEYEAVGNLLTKEFSVYAIDLLAFGESDPPPHFYSFSDHAATVLAFMDTLKIPTAYIYGNLVGANIAVHIASTYPERVKGLMLGQLCYYTGEPNHFLNLRNAPVFSEIPIQADGSHMMEYWNRSSKYGESPEISNDRAICLHKAKQHGESLHWALCEDQHFEPSASITVKQATLTVLSMPQN